MKLVESCLMLMGVAGLFVLTVKGDDLSKSPVKERSKRQALDFAAAIAQLRQQIQTYGLLIHNCQTETMTLKGVQPTPAPARKIIWIPYDNRRKRRSAQTNGAHLRRTFEQIEKRNSRNTNINPYSYNNNYNNYYYQQQQQQLQTALLSRKQQLEECTIQLEGLKKEKEEMEKKQQLAEELLNEVQAGSATLKDCIKAGGKSNADLAAIDRYIWNRYTFAAQQQQQQKQHQQQQRQQQQWGYDWAWLLNWDDRKRDIADVQKRTTPPNVDTIISQRQQWLAYVTTAVQTCWASIGRLSDGSLPTQPPPKTTASTTKTSRPLSTAAPVKVTAPPVHPLRVPPPPPPPPPPPAETTTTTTTTTTTSRPTTKTTTTSPPPTTKVTTKPKTTTTPKRPSTKPPPTTSPPTTTTSTTTTSTTTTLPTTTTTTTTPTTTMTPPTTTTTPEPTTTTSTTTTPEPTTTTSTTTTPEPTTTTPESTTTTQPTTTTTSTTSPPTTTTPLPTTTTTATTTTSTAATTTTQSASGTGAGLTTTSAPTTTPWPC